MPLSRLELGFRFELPFVSQIRWFSPHPDTPLFWFSPPRPIQQSSCGFYWSQIFDQAQDFPDQFPRHRHLSQLERDVPAMADHLGTDLHQLLP